MQAVTEIGPDDETRLALVRALADDEEADEVS
jgi:hypothetical protein